MPILTIEGPMQRRAPYEPPPGAREAPGEYFGFLPRPIRCEFHGIAMEPVPDYASASGWIASHTDHDGFVPPPYEQIGSFDPRTMQLLAVKGAPTVAPLFKLPASHLVKFPSGLAKELHRTHASFIIHLAAYLFDTWVQFENWWFSARVPVTGGHAPAVSDSTVQHFVAHCYDTWRSWPEKDQVRTTNLLFMHCRAPSYSWEFEQFTFEYLVTDACWRSAARTQQLSDPRHEERIIKLCEFFGIPQEAAAIKEIIDLRNDLVHEALWAGMQPTSGGTAAAFRRVYDLRRLNMRLIPAVLGYRNRYVQTPWWNLAPTSFDSL